SRLLASLAARPLHQRIPGPGRGGQMRRVGWRRGMMLTLFGLLAVGLLLTPAARAQPDACDGDLDGPPGVYLGGWIPAAFDNPRLPLERDPYGRFTTKAGGKRLAIVTWDPWNPNAIPPDRQQQYLMRDVAAGKYDGLISTVADQLAQFDGPLFL